MADKKAEHEEQQLLTVGAYDNRHRLFQEMRNPKLTEDERKDISSQYAAASKDFDDQRAKLINLGKGKIG